MGRLAAWLRSVDEAGASRRLWALPPLWRSRLGLHSQEGQAAKKGRCPIVEVRQEILCELQQGNLCGLLTRPSIYIAMKQFKSGGSLVQSKSR